MRILWPVQGLRRQQHLSTIINALHPLSRDPQKKTAAVTRVKSSEPFSANPEMINARRSIPLAMLGEEKKHYR